ncbi:MAG: hypothetical protein HY698_20280 [Deltaproteobacteria bacterium]|nr:hypothetical protein [Deltaproteobacteria bacterium]
MSAWQWAVLELIGLFALARGLEVFSSLARARAAREEQGVQVFKEPGWGQMVLTHVAIFVGSAASVILGPTVPGRPLAMAALVILALATALRAWMLLSLGGRWSVLVIDPGDVVTTGPYRFIRHPNYLAIVLEVAALPLVAGAYGVAAWGTLANALVLARRIPFEERFLAARFRAYREVMMKRPRFLPRLVARS